MKCYVYIVFRPDGTPCYVGRGRGGRWKRHLKNSHNPHLMAIATKAGFDLPIVKIREGLSFDEAGEIEKAFISAIGRKPNGPLVNMTDGGDGRNGAKDSPETIAKKRAAMITPENREKARVRALGNTNKRGKKLSQEARNNISRAHIGLKHSSETNEKRAAKNRGKKRTKEFCERMKARKGERRSAKARARMSEAFKGRVLSEEHKQKIRERTKAALSTPEMKAKLSESIRAAWARRKSKEGADFGREIDYRD